MRAKKETPCKGYPRAADFALKGEGIQARVFPCLTDPLKQHPLWSARHKGWSLILCSGRFQPYSFPLISVLNLLHFPLQRCSHFSVLLPRALSQELLKEVGLRGGFHLAMIFHILFAAPPPFNFIWQHDPFELDCIKHKHEGADETEASLPDLISSPLKFQGYLIQTTPQSQSLFAVTHHLSVTNLIW